MTAWEIVKTIFGGYINWEKEAGFIPSDQILSNDIKEGEEKSGKILLEESKKN